MDRTAALVVAHPGHELALHGWIEINRPLVFVLTDGSGKGGSSRLRSSERLLEKAGAARGGPFEALPDRRLYAALLGGDTELFLDLAKRIGAAFAASGISTVVADPAEGYNPAHDVCRLVADAAVRYAAAEGTSISSFDYPLTRPAAPDAPAAVKLVLDDAALARKRAAAGDYPEMRSEVESALSRGGAEAHRVETLRAVDPHADPFLHGSAVPAYEAYGESRVAAGHYAHVIRFRPHVLRVAEALSALSPAAR